MTRRLDHVAGLDGLRAIAVLLVMMSHARTPFLLNGSLGVDIFFVLSGFLITRILLNESTQTGRIDIGRFYVRRFMRLTPPLVLMLALYLAIAPFAWPTYGGHARDALVATAYLSDYGLAIWEIPKMLRHTWSLAVEEHFYLLWPLVLILLRPYRPRTLLLILGVGYVLATAWRVICLEFQGWNAVYYRFDTRISGLMLGALVAVLMHFEWQRFLKSGVLTLATLAGLLVLVLMLGPSSGWGYAAALQWGVAGAEIVTALAILAIMNKERLFGWLAVGPITYFGRLSYGIYLFHYPVMLYFRETQGWDAALLYGFISAPILAAVSYHTIEAWVRRWRERERARQSPVLGLGPGPRLVN